MKRREHVDNSPPPVFGNSVNLSNAVTRYRFECDIAMPSSFRILILSRKVHKAVFVYFLRLFRADDAYFVVFASQTSSGVADRVYMQLLRRWFS
jgi:hypothetical protein